MRVTFCILLCAIELYYQQCFGLNFIDLPGFGSDEKTEDVILVKSDKESISPTKVDKDLPSDKEQTVEGRRSLYSSYKEQGGVDKSIESNRRRYPPVRFTTDLVTAPNLRRHWLVSAPENIEATSNSNYEDKDENIKSKISLLVQQAMHDTEAKMKTVQKLKEKHRNEAPYRVGFILSMIKKSRDVLNELFNVAVKHRDEWKALEQLKIFELIVHTNVDTTNLVRQLVEIHIQHLNASAHSRYLRNQRLNSPRRKPSIPRRSMGAVIQKKLFVRSSPSFPND